MGLFCLFAHSPRKILFAPAPFRPVEPLRARAG